MSKNVFERLFFSFIVVICTLGSIYAQFNPCDLKDNYPMEANQLRVHRPFDYGWSFNGGFIRTPREDGAYISIGFDNTTTWIGAYQNGAIKVSAPVYFGASEYTYGPVAAGGASVSNCTDWAKVWEVNDFDILEHKADFEDNGIIDTPNKAIFSWPGKGNIHFNAFNGFDMPNVNEEYAPFFDKNMDGIYNPMDGDFPHTNSLSSEKNIRTMRWIIGGYYSELTPNFFPLERQITEWALGCEDSNDILSNSVFFSQKFTNRGLVDMDSTLFGIFFTPLLGGFTDDAFGFSVNQNTTYVYNKDNNDELVFGVPGFGENPPVSAMTILNKPVYKVMAYLNPTVGNPNPYQTDPNQAIEYWNYMNGKWRNGSPLTFGGLGNNPNSMPTDYIFNGNPKDSTDWSILSISQEPLDWRVLTSVFLGKLTPGASETVEYSFSYHQDATINHLDQIDIALNRVSDLRNQYDNTFANACDLIEPCMDLDCVWSGDTDGDGIVRFWDYLPVSVFSSELGNARNTQLNWYPYTVDNFGKSYNNGLDIKHIDADGNGEIMLSDNMVVEKHFGLKKTNYEAPTDEYLTGDDITLKFESGIDSFNIISPGSILIVGLELNTLNTWNGIAYTFEYDTSFFDLLVPTLVKSYTLKAPGIIDIALIDNENPLSQPSLGKVRLRAKLPMQVNSNETCVQLKNTKAISKSGFYGSIGSNQMCVNFSDVVLQTRNPMDSKITISPSPANEFIKLGNLPHFEKTFISIFSLNGKHLYSDIQLDSEQKFDVSKLETGVYFLQIRTQNGVETVKFVKI